MGAYIPQALRKSLPDNCLDCGEPLESKVHGEGEGQHYPVFFCKNVECFCGLCEEALIEEEGEDDLL